MYGRKKEKRSIERECKIVIKTVMKSSLILGSALFLALAVTNVVQARKDPCKDSTGREVVVKAAKVQKPLFYASPDAINRAAAAREGIGRLSASTGALSTSSTSSASSISSTSSSSSSSSSSFSSLGALGGQLGESNGNVLSPFSTTSGKLTSSCGCNKKSGSLQLYDLLSSEAPGQIVPTFAPIGDLCYPNSNPSSKSNFEITTTTKVTPAYPGKLKVVPSSKAVSQEICVNTVNGQVDQAGLQKLGLSTSSNNWAGQLGSSSTLNGVDSVFGQSWNKQGNINSGSLESFGLSNSRAGGSQAISSAGSLGSFGLSNSRTGGSQAVSSISSLGLTSSQSSSLNGNSLASSSLSSTNFGCNEFGDELELPQDYSYPGLPADPVSLTLAYKNLFPRVLYNKKPQFVPEDKLAFGHRTVPTESSFEKKTRPDVPEEKLQILDKPVVELKPVNLLPVTVGVYDEHEEAKLAELEAIEREKIRQEELSRQSQGHYITYGDLGYEPVNGIKVSTSTSALQAGSFVDHDDVGCGPIGPAVPDFVPGSVVINREFVGTENEFDDVQNTEEAYNVQRYLAAEASDEEDDEDDPSSGIFARLQSISRKSSGCASF